MTPLIRNLPLATKFLLLALLALGLILLPASRVLMLDLNALRTVERERLGIAPARTTLALEKSVQRLASARDQGVGAVVAAQADAQRTLDALVPQLVALEHAPASAREARLRTLLQAPELQQPGPRGEAALSAVKREIPLLLDDIAEGSLMSLHPEAAGYYMQLTVLNLMPRVLETASHLQREVQADPSGEDPQRRGRVMELAQRLANEQAAVDRALGSAVNADPALEATMGAARRDALAAGGQTAQVLGDRLAAPADPNPERTLTAVASAVKAQDALVDVALGSLSNELDRQAATARQRLLGLVALLLAGTGLGAWVMVVTTRTTTRAAADALRLAEAVAQGDLQHGVQATGRDEIGRLVQALEAMRRSLANVVHEVRGNAEQVASASTQIAQGNLDLSQRTENQAAALQQTAASMEELQSTIQTNADNATEVHRLAREADARAQSGHGVVRDVVARMRSIEESAREIQEIVGTIDSIAFQTNILALNAAVEAARAGEQGRGFAVVAGEVRVLASRSAEAAKQIKRLIADSTERVHDGVALAEQAGGTMGELLQSVQRVSTLVGEISHATIEQSSGVQQVGTAVTQMDQVTQQNAALVEESAAAADSLRQQADRLAQAVSRFQLPSGHGEGAMA